MRNVVMHLWNANITLRFCDEVAYENYYLASGYDAHEAEYYAQHDAFVDSCIRWECAYSERIISRAELREIGGYAYIYEGSEVPPEWEI